MRTVRITPRVVYGTTLVAVALGVFLNIAFATGKFTLSHLWGQEYVAENTIWTYLSLAFVALAGIMTARRLPAEGISLELNKSVTGPGEVEVDDVTGSKLLFGSRYIGGILLRPISLFVGFAWLAAGEHKVRDAAWMDKGVALVNPDPEVAGFWERVTAIPQPPARPAIHADFGWYRDFLTYMMDQGWAGWFAKLVAIGEVAIGLGLIFGALLGIAAIFGIVLNLNFMLAGTASTNPVLLMLSIPLVVGYKVAGYYGLDRWVLTALGTPWSPGRLLDRGAVAPHATPAD
jgi:thiosulfate dehydrogenase [quinone] large subunit